MRSWLVGVIWAVLAVVLPATSTRADNIIGTDTWVATETTVEATPTTQIYSWSFVGSSDFTLVNTFSTFGSPFDFLTFDVVSGVPRDDILGTGFPDDGTVFDALLFLTGGEFTRSSGCSLTDFPPCEPGVTNIYSVTIPWVVGPFGADDELFSGCCSGNPSITLLESFPTPTPEPSTLLLLGTGLVGLSCLGKWNQSRSRRTPRP